ncbi:MAG: hypothetical protein OEW19_20365, partial [Acidobacteriota bacterium]|nr:hypothetical protein [Acidobacteriota bacterium]
GSDNRLGVPTCPPVIAGPSVALRASGAGRYAEAGFLVVWLAAWLLGEIVALVFLATLLRSVLGAAFGMPWPIPGGEWIADGSAAFVLIFILGWLAVWTVGGIAAIDEFLRSVSGEDTVSMTPAGVELVRRAGPFRRTRRFERPGIRRVRLRASDKAVVLDAVCGTEVLTPFGSLEERHHLVDWLRRQLSLPEDGAPVDAASAPPGWTMTVEGGVTRVTDSNSGARRAGALVAWIVVALLVLVAYGSLRSGPVSGASVALGLSVPFALLAVWLSGSHREWLVQQGRLTRCRRFAGWTRERAFQNARLTISHRTDSDNDSHCELKVIDEQGSARIARAMNADTEVVDVGRWLAARTGFSLES